MTLKKLALIFCILTAVIICSCDSISQYTFNNKSSSSVEITLSKPYKEVNSTDAAYYKSSFSIYSNNKKTVFVDGNDVDFSWTSYNTNVQCTVNGSEAVFRDQ